MKIMSSMKSAVNNGLASANHMVTKIASSPEGIGKVNRVVLKLIEIANYAKNTEYAPELVKQLKNTNCVISFVGLYDSLTFWVNPYDIKNLDKKGVKRSLEKVLVDSGSTEEDAKKRAKSIVKDLMIDGEKFVNEEQTRQGLVKKMEPLFNDMAAVYAKEVKIGLKQRSFAQYVSKSFETFGDVQSAVATLKKWEVVDLGQVASEVGTRIRVFVTSFRGVEVSTNVGKVAGQSPFSLLSKIPFTVVGVGMTISFVYTTYKIAILQHQILYGDASKVDKLVKQRNKCLWTFAVLGSELALMAIPAVIVLSPPVLLGMGFAAKTIGFVSFLNK